MFVKLVNEMSEETKKKFVNTIGITVLCLSEGKCSYHISKELKLPPWQVDRNIDELIYTLRHTLGWKRFIRALFIK